MTITHDNTLTNKQKDMDKFDLIPQTIVKASVIEELKRLQLEINEANKTIDSLSFLFAIGEAKEEERFADNQSNEAIIKNTARIREIILNEL